jgi:hypothetical protein
MTNTPKHCSLATGGVVNTAAPVRLLGGASERDDGVSAGIGLLRHRSTSGLIAVLSFIRSCATQGVDALDAKRVFSDPRTAELAAAAASGDAGRVKALVRVGANVHARGDKNVTLLQWAMLNKSTTGMEALLAAGADPSEPGVDNDTVVHLAAMVNDQAAKINQPQRVLELLQAGANPSAANVTGATFQYFLFLPPDKMVTPAVRRGRDAVRNWLHMHHIPIEDTPAY